MLRVVVSPITAVRLAGPALLAFGLGIVLAGTASAEAGAVGSGTAGSTAAASARSDPEAVALAEKVLDRIGGREAWDGTRYLKWRFFDRRLHHWDRFTGDVRIESEDLLVLMNLGSREGRAFFGGEEITDPAARAEALEKGYAWWVNDSYWLLMPAKLLDPGVRLQGAGPDALEDGRAAHKLVVTFDAGTGLTPKNKYEVWVADDTGLVEQWAYYPDAADPEPSFVSPWAGWKSFGDPPVLLATSRGRGYDWEIEVPAAVPRTLFEQP
jgi:hypothetical protein